MPLVLCKHQGRIDGLLREEIERGRESLVANRLDAGIRKHGVLCTWWSEV